MMRLESQRLIMQEAQQIDILPIVEFLNKNHTFHQNFDPIRSKEYFTESFWTDKLESEKGLSFDQKGCQFFIKSLSDPITVIGFVNFSNVIRGCFQSCTVGYALDEHMQGQGFMTEALEACIVHIFSTQNLHRIQANYMPNNLRSAQLLSTLGFVIEGTAKDYLRINGAWEDHVLTSLINPNWSEPN